MVNVAGKQCVVVGLGETGLSVVRFLHAQGARVRVNDRRQADTLGNAAVEAEALGAALFLGGHPDEAFDGAEVIVVSPGVPPLGAIDRAEAAGALVVSEVELAARFIAAPIVAVTGTNGKSTVTTMLGRMCERLGVPLFVGGNLGRPMVEAIGTDAASARGLVLVELSSFQLERVSTFRAHVAVLLNVTADHLDRYPSFDAYAAAKSHIFDRQGPDDFAILPAYEPKLRELVHGEGAVLQFGGNDGDVRVDAGSLVDAESGLRIPITELRVRGSHNASNACAAALAARLLGVGTEGIGEVLRDFAGLPHRMQHVRTTGGVDYVDDSKATNVGAAVASIEGLDERPGRVVLIAGGVDKGGGYEALRDRMDAQGRGVVLIGDAAPLIERAFEGSPLVMRRAGSMEAAVGEAAALAEPGDTVLLAPACSSFDMFRSYTERGDVFQRAVVGLGGTP
ncbi:MAG: UDP-N-acetylmuramoyl-L-alanine--D-glutamate ligase [Polyangiales bacterium]